ncbi:MAG: DSD1 family PLP-dependent enzyme [Burkholderiaceae bacterium]
MPVNPPPARVGDSLGDILTPALVVDLDAFEANLDRLRARCEGFGVRLRAHAKTHKSADIGLLQMSRGGACGVCCQKVSEAEAMVAGGITDVLVSNQVIGAARIARLVALARQARVIVCVDDAGNVDELAAAAGRAGVTLECLVEIDTGMGRCGVRPGAAAVALAQRVAGHPSLRFAGLQAYDGRAQHVYDYDTRRARIDGVVAATRETVRALQAAGLDCDIVGGAGTGTYGFEAASGVYNELQCGSYVFMDVDYGRVREAGGAGLSEFANSLFVLSTVMSVAVPGTAVCDAGLKALATDSGPPVVRGHEDLAVKGVSDEHTILADPGDSLTLGQRLWLIPGHCDPTCNLYDWYVAVRGGRVEALWPVSARGCLV